MPKRKRMLDVRCKSLTVCCPPAFWCVESETYMDDEGPPA